MQTDATLLGPTCCVRLHGTTTIINVGTCWRLLRIVWNRSKFYSHANGPNVHCWPKTPNNTQQCCDLLRPFARAFIAVWNSIVYSRYKKVLCFFAEMLKYSKPTSTWVVIYCIFYWIWRWIEAFGGESPSYTGDTIIISRSGKLTLFQHFCKTLKFFGKANEFPFILITNHLNHWAGHTYAVL